MKDQRSLKDYFINKQHDNEPDEDGAVPGSSGVSTRSKTSKSKGTPTNEQNLQIAKALRKPRHESMKAKGKKKSTAAKNALTTSELPVGDPVLATGAGRLTPEDPVDVMTSDAGTEGPPTLEAPVGSVMPGPETGCGGPCHIENDYLKQANIELKQENTKLKKRMKELQNTIDSLRKENSVTRNMILKKPTKHKKQSEDAKTPATKKSTNKPGPKTNAKPRKSVTWKKADIEVTYDQKTTINVPQNKPNIMTVGSSLATGTRDALRRQGVESIECSYSGAQLPYIRSQMKRKLEENPQVDTVVVLGGGNDCEARHHIEDIKYEYDALVDEVKLTLGAETNIIISSIPQRKRAHYKTHLKIAELNAHNSTFYAGSEYDVTYVDAAPRFGDQFVDRVHFNYYGLDHWASKISAAIKDIEGQSI